MKRAMTRKSNDGKDGFKSRGTRDPRRERTGAAGGRPRPGGKPFRPSPPPDGPMRAPSPAKDADRIAKVIARAGLASRREAEAWIAAGRVAVNDRVIASPALNVTAADRITIDGAPLPARERTRLFLYHKPRGLVTTNADPEGRPTIFDALAKNLPRLISVGRLDIGTEGLLLLTNDGGLARVLELPETGWLRRYRVRALGRITQHDLDGMRDGVTVEGIHYGPIEATLDREQGANVWLTFAIREGKNREVRNVLEHIGLQVNRLIRLSFGPFQLGDLAEGATEEVKTRALRDQLGERITAQANCDFSAPIVERAQEPAPTPPRIERGARRPPEERAPERRGESRDRPRHGGRADKPAGRPHRGDERRREGRRDGERPDKPAGRPRRGHAWRQDDAPLRRHYRGGADESRRPKEEHAAQKRAGLLTDRKGRRVLVERFGEKPPVEAKPRRDQRPPRQGKSRRPDRARGPRPSRPGRPKDR
jgi:23S rRNA pseudouridine2605 synthase